MMLFPRVQLRMIVCVFFICCSALLYSVFGVAIEKARGAEDDVNTVTAGTLTGMLFKSTGERHADSRID